MDYTKHWKEILGGYIEANEDAVVKNDMKHWTHECISLVISDNI